MLQQDKFTLVFPSMMEEFAQGTACCTETHSSEIFFVEGRPLYRCFDKILDLCFTRKPSQRRR